MNLKDHFPNAAGDFVKANPAIFGDMGNDLALGRGPTSKNDVQPIVATKRRGSMNKTEAGFALYLEALKRKGEIDGWKFEPIRLNLAERTTYTPDFLMWKSWMFVDGKRSHTWLDLKFIEIKGFKRDDAMVKYKVAREQFPWVTFEMWTKGKNGWARIL